ncbi:Cyclic di-GMP phosphodiesterase PdeB [Burkholderiaceae bacterium]|nr:Cyclic di-GMP phosphodiesterase PdeB [Burkholderiaceae bacterium]
MSISSRPRTAALRRLAAIPRALPWLALALPLALAVTGLLSGALDLHLVFGIDWFAPSPGLIAAGLLLAALAWWAQARRGDRKGAFDSLLGERQILVASLAFVGVAAIGAALLGIAGEARSRLEATNAALAAAVDSRSKLLDEVLEASSRRAAHAASRVPELPPAAQAVNHQAFLDAKVQISLFARSLVDTGYSGAVVTTGAGHPVVAVGDVAPSHGLMARFVQAVPTQLLWDDGLVLRSRAPVGDRSGALGTIQLDQRLEALWRDFFIASGFGSTGEVQLCAGADSGIQCIVGRADRAPSATQGAEPGGPPTPMALAIAGQSGVMRFVTPQGEHVLAAYAPLAPQLGVVVQQHASEAFAPLRRTLQWTLPLLALLVLASALGVRAQIKPLAARLGAAQREAQRNEAQIRAVVDSVVEGIFSISEDWTITDANRAACDMFGYDSVALIGRELVDLVPARLRESHRAAIVRYRETGESMVVGQRGVELLACNLEGREFPVELTLSEMLIDGNRAFTGVVRDITARKEAERRLFNEKELLRVTLGAIGDGVITVDRSGRVTYLNPVAESMTGWSCAQAAGRAASDLLHLVDGGSRERVPDPAVHVLRSSQALTRDHDVVLVSRDGSERPLEDAAAPIFDAEGQLAGAVVVLHDVTRARKLAAQLSYQATHDPLTGLLNRAAFEDRLDDMLAAPGDEGQTHGLLFIDLDQFKVVNDTCGHAAGDLLLRQLAKMLRAALRRADTIARLGGDEFAVLLHDCPPQSALQVADNLRAQVQDHVFTWEARRFHVGASIGLVCFSPGEFDRAGVLRAADSACYVAKEKGRNRIHAFHANDADLVRRAGEMDWVSRLHHALAEDRFVLYAQPIVGLHRRPDDTPRFEILLRLLDEDGRLVPPMAFIPAAERYNLMAEIDRWVIGHALAEHRRHRDALGCAVHYSINLSGASLSQEGLGDFIGEQLAIQQTPRGEICFEVTETVAVANLDAAIAFLGRIREAGCEVALDDFGAGMSSFNYLKRLPLDYLKIDGGLVKRIGEDAVHRAMVEAIHKIGRLMSLRTVAEFVEDDAILGALRGVGVDFVQGYGIARPEPLVTSFAALEPRAQVADEELDADR